MSGQTVGEFIARGLLCPGRAGPLVVPFQREANRQIALEQGAQAMDQHFHSLSSNAATGCRHNKRA